MDHPIGRLLHLLGQDEVGVVVAVVVYSSVHGSQNLLYLCYLLRVQTDLNPAFGCIDIPYKSDLVALLRRGVSSQFHFYEFPVYCFADSHWIFCLHVYHLCFTRPSFPGQFRQSRSLKPLCHRQRLSELTARTRPAGISSLLKSQSTQSNRGLQSNPLPPGNRLLKKDWLVITNASRTKMDHQSGGENLACFGGNIPLCKHQNHRLQQNQNIKDTKHTPSYKQSPPPKPKHF